MKRNALGLHYKEDCDHFNNLLVKVCGGSRDKVLPTKTMQTLSKDRALSYGDCVEAYRTFDLLLIANKWLEKCKWHQLLEITIALLHC